MKAGIAHRDAGDARAARNRRRRCRHRIVMLWTTDEEIGSESSRAAIEDEARRSGAVLVLEPSLPGGAVKTSRKGCGCYQLTRPRRGGACRHRAAERRERGAGAGAPDSPRQRASGSRARRLGQRRAGVGRPALQRDSGRGARHRRRAGADGGGRGRDRRGVPRACSRSTAGRRSRRPGGIDRPPLERTGLVERLYRAGAARSRARSARIWPKAAPAADRTGISPPRSGFRR